MGSATNVSQQMRRLDKAREKVRLPEALQAYIQANIDILESVFVKSRRLPPFSAFSAALLSCYILPNNQASPAFLRFYVTKIKVANFLFIK